MAKYGKKAGEKAQKAVKGYLNHAAREGTIIFPAWKQTMTGEQFDEMTISLKTSSVSSSANTDLKMS
jgi:hypothetical protein